MTKKEYVEIQPVKVESEPSPAPKRTGWGKAIAVIIIMALIILGSWYFLGLEWPYLPTPPTGISIGTLEDVCRDLIDSNYMWTDLPDKTRCVVNTFLPDQPYDCICYNSTKIQ